MSVSFQSSLRISKPTLFLCAFLGMAQFIYGFRAALLGENLFPWDALHAIVVGEKLEIIARGTYYKANGTALEVGRLDDYPVYAFFEPYGEYEEAGVELGLRFYIAAAARLKSYVAPIVGARWLSETYIDLEIPDAGTAIRYIPFHRKNTVAVFGLDIGFTFDLGEHFFVGVDTGLRYQGPPKEADGLPGLPEIDDSDGRWSAPVSATISIRF